MGNKATVRDFGEKRIIAEIIRPMCEAAGSPPDIGIGDDSAMLTIPPGKSLLVSTDKIPEDLLAIQLGLMDAYHHGRYLATVNISDIAAMGGQPAGLLVTLALPEDFTVEYLSELYRGIIAGCGEWGISVIGGDLGWGSVPCMSATVMGFINPAQALKRTGADVDDKVFVTGVIGGFNTALLYFIVAKPRGLTLEAADENFLKGKLIHPIAQVRKGQLLAASGMCTSCMDITDGVARTLFELSACSKRGLLIEEEMLPIHRATIQVAKFLGMEPRDIVFGIGLDLELMGTIRCNKAEIPASLANEITIIGTVTETKDNRVRSAEGTVHPIPERGWQHFVGKAMDMVKNSVPAQQLP